MTTDDDYYYSNLLGQTFGSEGNCDSFHFHSQGEEKQATTDAQATLPVSEALRLHSGSVKVQGMIVGRSQLYKMIVSTTLNCTSCNYQIKQKHEPPLVTCLKREKTKCPSCNENTLLTTYEYVNAITVELQDIDAFSEIERLPAILFDKDTMNIVVGERVTIIGEINIVQVRRGGGKSLPFVYAKSIAYESKEDIVITDLDRNTIERFTNANGSRVIEKLVSMMDASII